jgi:hypothetical protein
LKVGESLALVDSQHERLRARTLSVVGQHVGRCYVDRHTKDLCRLSAEGDEVEQSSLRVYFHEQIDIAVRTPFVSGNRSEHPDIVRAVVP